MLSTLRELAPSGRSDPMIALAPPGDHGYFNSFKPELEDFAALVLDGKPPVAPPEKALGEMRTALALYRSAESGAWESVWSV